jgi:hypothetical protein
LTITPAAPVINFNPDPTPIVVMPAEINIRNIMPKPIREVQIVHRGGSGLITDTETVIEYAEDDQ